MRYNFYHPVEIELMVKALQCIETMCENNCLDTEIPVTQHPPNCKWCAIYEIAHAGRSPSCRDSHLKWEEDILKLHEEFSKI